MAISSHWKPGKELRNLSINLALSLLSVVVCVAALELSVRVIVPSWYPPYAFAADKDIGYVNTPNMSLRWTGDEFDFSTRTNELGLRDYPLKKDGRLVVLALGDSFCWGFGVEFEKIYLAILEKSIGARIVKAGVCGYGTLHAEKLLRKIGPQIQPDVVMLNFFIGNDFYENTGVRNLTVVDGRLREIPPQNSSFVHKAITILRGRLRIVELAIGRIKSSPPLFGFVRRLGLAGGDLIGEMDLYATTESPQVTGSYDTTKKMIEKLNRSANNIGAKLVVVLIPTKNQVDPERFENELGRMNLDPAGYDLDRPNRILNKTLDELGIKSLDLLPGFRANRKSKPDVELYFAIDKHWNESGHQVAAGLIAESGLLRQ